MHADATFHFYAIGTKWQIDLFSTPPKLHLDSLRERIQRRVAIFEENYSRFRPDSFLSKSTRQSGSFLLPDDAKPLFDIYLKLYELTDGAFTPLIGGTLEDAGYNADYTLKPKQSIYSPKSWNEILEYCYPRLTIKEACTLDFGAAGKGYTIDIVSDMLRQAGISFFTVEAGGDIRFDSPDQTLRVGLEHPKKAGEEIIGVATIQNLSICGSAGNRRSWGSFHHIINATTLRSPTDVLATWVAAKDTLTADALATALFLVPPQRLTSTFSFEYVIVYDNFSADISRGFPGEIFT